ncbi:hypothetical protein LSTR_LSTR007188 [Laodelphax striatellus]|uniref:C2H2-type domain-containing protein n=1 Tax=Laodelphax striatellus TaxID=195883 RepID=A0A482WWU7_LAOST|nr:hypothetical protein LSTR_LSTR007188 [Laodelphax striatellus]
MPGCSAKYTKIMFLTNGTQILKTIQTVPNQELTTTDSDNMYSSAVTADPNFMKVTEFVLPSGSDHLVDSMPQQTISVDALSSAEDASYHPLNVTEDGGQLLLESATIEPMEEAVATIQQHDFEQQTIEQPEEHQEREVGEGGGGGEEGGEGEVERQGELEAAAQLQPGPEPEQALQPNPISRIWSDIDVSPPLRKGPHFCELCSRKYDSWSVYKKHMKSHLEDKPYRCKKCPATFNVPNNLLLHEATHNTDNLSCPIKDCLKRFNRLASLKAHLNSHQQEESLFCTECGDEFNNQLQLDKHATEHYQDAIRPAANV